MDSSPHNYFLYKKPHQFSLPLCRYTYGKNVKGKAKVEISFGTVSGRILLYMVDNEQLLVCGENDSYCRFESPFQERECGPWPRCPRFELDTEVPLYITNCWCGLPHEGFSCITVYWWLKELPKRFTSATHKCVSLFWWIFSGTFHWCRKVTMHKCPCINVLCVATHKWWNKPKMVMGKTEPMEKFGKLSQWKICVSCFPSAERSPRKNVLSVATHPCWNRA